MSKHKDITLPLVRRAFLAGLVGIMSLAGTAEAQNCFNMPFSQFGIGLSDLPYTMPMAQRSGAIITRAGNNYINPFNPASYASIESQSFVFDMGLNIQTSRLSSGSQSATDADGNIGYLAIGMPITSWWKVGAGLMPYSSMDYSSVSVQQGDGYGTMKTIYDGTGGASQVFVGSAFNIPAGKSTRLQAGFNVSYLTGRVERAISYRFMGNDSTYYINSRRYKRTKVSNVVLDFGVQMWQELGEKLTLGAGLTYKPYMDLTVGDMALIYTYSTSDESLIDTIFPARGEEPEFRSRLEQPQSVGVGLSLQYDKCWTLSLDATFASWSGMRYTEDTAHAIFGTNAIDYGPTSRYALGLERTGDMDASTYWGRISWSLGAHIEQNAMRLTIDGTDHKLDSWGIGAGISLPMRKGRSLLTLSVGYSSMGDIDILRRDCLTVGIGVSSCERWFTKRKYN